METFMSKMLAQPQAEVWFTTEQLVVMVVLMAWSLVWKGLALWKASRLGSKPWFVVLLIVNTLGLLEIIYFFFVGKKDNTPMQ